MTNTDKALKDLESLGKWVACTCQQSRSCSGWNLHMSISLVQSQINVIEPPPDPPLKSKLRQALFNCKSVKNKAPRASIPFICTTDNIFEFTAIFTNLVTYQLDVGAKFLTLWSLDTMISPLDRECTFFYQGCIFFPSLELVPIHDNRALEFAHPTRTLTFHPMSFWWSPYQSFLLNSSLVTWQQAHVSWYYLMEVLWTDQFVLVRNINPFFGDPNMDGNNPGLDNVQLHLQWTKCTFEVGNSVEITFGPHNGISGMLIAIADEMVTVMTINFASVSKDLHLMQLLLVDTVGSWALSYIRVMVFLPIILFWRWWFPWMRLRRFWHNQT